MLVPINRFVCKVTFVILSSFVEKKLAFVMTEHQLCKHADPVGVIEYDILK